MVPTGCFPVTDAGEVPEPPEDMPLDRWLAPAEGRKIFLVRIQQHRRYGGMFCGQGFGPERTVVEAIEAARTWDRNSHGEPVVVPPTIVRGPRLHRRKSDSTGLESAAGR